VLLLADQDAAQQLVAAVVAQPAEDLDRLVEELDRRVLELEVRIERFAYVLADLELVVALQVGHALEVQDPLDHLVGVLHLVDRLGVDLLRQLLEAPVAAELGVDEVLVDRGQLVGEQIVQDAENLGVALHQAARDFICTT
jgi:hypothetical protein